MAGGATEQQDRAAHRERHVLPRDRQAALSFDHQTKVTFARLLRRHHAAVREEKHLVRHHVVELHRARRLDGQIRGGFAQAVGAALYEEYAYGADGSFLTGTFADGLGNVKTDANRIAFDPFPWQSFAVWIMTQMKRWGQIKGDVDYKTVAEQVFLATDTSKLMKEAGLKPPTTTTKSFAVMGKTFDPSKPEDYIKSFKIKKSV